VKARSPKRPPWSLTSSPTDSACCARASVSSGGVFDVDSLTSRRDELEIETADPNLWNDRARAEAATREKNALERELALYQRIETDLDDAEVLLELANEVDDDEARGEASQKFDGVEQRLDEAELRQLLGGEHDASNALLSINSGAGGTDACDWAEMLLRMYLRWAERRGFKTEILDLQAGDEAGIRSVTIKVSGEYAYGYLNSEQGVHRLVRISPFDSQARRHTAFASVTAVPEIDDAIEVDIDESDLRVDTYRASGAGGQHVNKTDSAIRLTHLPTKTVVQCQNERSQHKNKAFAMKVLRSRLYQLEEEEQKKKLDAIQGEKKDIAWGSQIRSYVLHPYRLIKDHRTSIETGRVDNFLDGDIDEFIDGYLLRKLKGDQGA